MDPGPHTGDRLVAGSARADLGTELWPLHERRKGSDSLPQGSSRGCGDADGKGKPAAGARGGLQRRHPGSNSRRGAGVGAACRHRCRDASGAAASLSTRPGSTPRGAGPARSATVPGVV